MAPQTTNFSKTHKNDNNQSNLPWRTTSFSKIPIREQSIKKLQRIQSHTHANVCMKITGGDHRVGHPWALSTSSKWRGRFRRASWGNSGGIRYRHWWGTSSSASKRRSRARTPSTWSSASALSPADSAHRYPDASPNWSPSSHSKPPLRHSQENVHNEKKSHLDTTKKEQEKRSKKNLYAERERERPWKRYLEISRRFFSVIIWRENNVTN